MPKKIPAAPPGEHPLMPNHTLRSIYAGLSSAQALLSNQKRQPVAPTNRATLADTACWVVPLVGLTSADIAFSCRNNGLIPHLYPRLAAGPLLPDAVNRLHAAVGAATVTARLPSHPVVLALFERHETAKPAWTNALALAAELPILLIVLPRWKGREDAIDLGGLARATQIPAIPVDAQDPIALYRVAQEAILRARTGGGAALLEAVYLPTGETATRKLAAFLLNRGIASKAWLEGVDRANPK